MSLAFSLRRNKDKTAGANFLAGGKTKGSGPQGTQWGTVRKNGS